jgi:hypothetical protein
MGGDPMAAAGGGAVAPPPPTATASGADETPDADPSGQTPPEGTNIPEPEPDDIKKFDLEIQDYESEQDREDIDYSVGDEG